MTVTVTLPTGLAELVSLDLANDRAVLWDNDAALLKYMSINDFLAQIHTGAISTVYDTDLAIDRALISDGDGKIDVSAATATELGYLSGLSSAAQTQLNALDARIAAIETKPVVNHLINSDFVHAPLGTMWAAGTSNDGDVRFPGWVLLSNGNGTINPNRNADATLGFRGYYASLNQNAGFVQSGFLQILEHEETRKLWNQAVSLAFDAKDTLGGSVRAMIAAWSSTADTPTVDLVGTWADPITSLATNWTSLGTTDELPLSSSWVRHSLENISIATPNNLAVFLYTVDVGGGGSAAPRFANIQLQTGAAATAYVPKPVTDEIKDSNRRYQRFAGDAAGTGPAIYGYASAGSQLHINWISFLTEMLKIPTVANVAGTWAVVNCTGPTINTMSKQGFGLTATASAAGAFSLNSNGTDDYIEFGVGW